MLFLRARKPLREDRETPLSHALGFLVRDYDSAYFWCDHPSYTPWTLHPRRALLHLLPC